MPAITKRLTLWLALFMSFAWSVISVAVCLNALVQSRSSEKEIQRFVQPPTKVDIDVNDVYHTGVVVSVVSLLIALFTASFLFLFFISVTKHRKFLTGQAFALAFLSVWLFATMIPLSHFVRTRSAIVHATLGSTTLPDNVVKAVEKSLGITSVYKEINYLKWMAILPWFAFLFTAIASLVVFHASRDENVKLEEPGSKDGLKEKETKPEDTV